MSSDQPFLRSINLSFDAAYPERIAHYEPTGKAVRFLEGLSNLGDERAFFVIAPYGSGKSIGATYLLHLLENQRSARNVLVQVAQRLERVSPALHQLATERLDASDSHRVVIALEGAVDDLGAAFAEAAANSLHRIGLAQKAREIREENYDGDAGAKAVLRDLQLMTQRTTGKTRLDGITVLWDEFGRHVESLIRRGDPHRLSEIQVLAEQASRSRNIPISLGLILHQNLLQYASGLSQSALAEWRKIEGRFEPIQYIDDSYEVYRFIAQLVRTHRRTEDLFGPSSERLQTAQQLGFLAGSGDDTLALFEDAWPLEPATLHVLPRLAARAAQHERTLFGFVFNADLSRPVEPSDLYDFFAPAMQADTALGGTYRKWLETESALTKAEDDAEARALKTASVLELGFSGERLRVTRDLLEFAIDGGQTATDTVDNLLERKLLLHRRRSDEVSLWHGTDVDLRSRLDEELARRANEFDLVDELNREFRPPALRPVRHNDDFAIRRFFEAEFVGVEQFAQALAAEEALVGVGKDGRIIYLLAGEETERKHAFELARACTSERVVVVVPTNAAALHSAAAEVHCLEHMRGDKTLLAEDPLLEKELQQMLDEAQVHLHTQLERLRQPGDSTWWFHRGEALPVHSTAGLLESLSAICDAYFPKTPRINNEMIVRHRLSAPLVNARKKVLLGVLERHGQHKVGIEGEHADASVFRTVLERTGLYLAAEEGVRYRYAKPEELDDVNLSHVWRLFKNLIVEPSEQPKCLATFFEQLTQPPYGMRRGVLPILFGAAVRAFESAFTITDDKGEYLDDLLPSHIEAICQAPHRYRFQVLDLSLKARDYLASVIATFGTSDKNQARNNNDLIRQAFDAFEAWRQALPPGARDTRTVGSDGKALQSVVRRPASPVQLLFRQVPELAGTDHLTDAEHWLREAKAELDGVVERYRESALRSLSDGLQIEADDRNESVRVQFERWRSLLPTHTAEHLGGVAKNVIKLNVDFYADDKAFVDALGAIIVGKKPQRWDDSELQRFRNEISSLTTRIEAVALGSSGDTDASTTLIEKRLKTFASHLASAVGHDEAGRRLNHILSELEVDHGSNERRTRQG